MIDRVAFTPTRDPGVSEQMNATKKLRLRRESAFSRFSARPRRRLELDLLRQVQRIVYLDPEIADCALNLRMKSQQRSLLSMARLNIARSRLRRFI
jgi:hypothetical protein